METTRAGSATLRGKTAIPASASLKTAALRAKTAAGAAVDSRKRKRGALQDISNSSTRIGGGSAIATAAKKTAVGALSKPAGTGVTKSGIVRGTTKRLGVSTSTTSTNVRGRATKTTAATNASADPSANVTKRRRQDDKIQTSLLSFQSMAPTSKGNKSLKTDANSALDAVKEEPATTQSDSQATLEMTQDADMIECHETLLVKSETEMAPAATVHSTCSATATATTTAAVKAEQDQGEIPPYTPRPYVFKFDHRDSGFDEATYAAEVYDIDAPFQNSAIHCVKIARDMDRFHFQHETKYHAEPTYIGDVQLDINEKMRAILVDWLVEVGEEYELDSQTFHKTVNLVDRCLAKFKINRKQFQLLGCACMMIAAKFEEVYGPNVDEFVYISDQTYTSEEMLEMETKVLHALEYRIASTTCHGFLPRFSRAGCNSDKQKSLVLYLCDFAILHYDMLQYRPSQLAAAAVYLSRLMTNEEQPWTPTLHHITQYNAWDLQPCVMELYRLHRAENEIVENQRDKAKAVSEKYVADKFHGVSAIPSMDEATLERSFLVYEQPSYMVKVQADATDANSSTGESE